MNEQSEQTTAPAPAHDNNNRGALFVNQYYVAGGNMPNYRGTLVVEGKAYRVAAWVKVANSGQKYMSLSVTPQSPQTQDVAAPTHTTTQPAPEPKIEMENLPF